MSPERLLGESYDASADIWSVGITIIQLWLKQYPFAHVADTPIHLSGEFQSLNLDKLLPRSKYSDNMRNFLKATLGYYPKDRADSFKLTKSVWFDQYGIGSLLEAHAVCFFL